MARGFNKAIYCIYREDLNFLNDAKEILVLFENIFT